MANYRPAARRAGIAAAWVLATLAAIFVADQAVGGVRDQVTDRRPTLPGITAALAPTETAAPDVPVATVPASSEVPAAGPVTTMPAASAPPATTVTASDDGDTAAAPATTVAASTGSPPTTAPQPASPPTTDPPQTSAAPGPAPFEFARYNLVGGFVELKYRPDEVLLVGATPNPGFSVKVSKSGPDAVAVEFEGAGGGEEYEGHLEAEWSHGSLDVHIEESGDD